MRKKVTGAIPAPVHVELAPGRREAVIVSGRRRIARRRGGQVGPVHGDGVVDVQIPEVHCTRQAGHQVTMTTLERQ